MSKPEPVTVTGGVGSVTAWPDDLRLLSLSLRQTASALADAAAELAGIDLAVPADPHDFWQLARLCGEQAAIRDQLARLVFQTAALASGLAKAAALYEQADQGVLDAVLGGLRHFALGLGDALGMWSVGSVREQVWAGLPAITDLLGAGSVPLMSAYTLTVPDGRPVLHDLGTDERPEAVRAPRSLADLMDELALRNGGHDGEISVSFVVGADGQRRAIVDIPGTKSWDPLPNRDVTSVGTDIRAMTGRDTSYEDGVFAALRAAGVGPDTEVMLVGHSEGGTIAVNAARDAARSGRFRITHVVTAGAPIGRVSAALPARVQVLALENAADVVPETDGASNPDRRNITTVTVDDQRYSIIGNHDIGTVYERAAEAADASHAVSVTHFERSAASFLSGGELRTHAYWITRDP